MRVLSRLFRRLFIEGLLALHEAGRLAFFGARAGLADAHAFAAWLAPMRKTEWGVCAKTPFGGPEAVLAYLGRHTHRVAISNHRLASADAGSVAFRWKDYRIKRGDRMRIMRLDTHEVIRRFLTHVRPDRFHRIRHYGLLASARRKKTVTKLRALPGAAAPSPPETENGDAEATTPPLTLREPCPDCGGAMHIIETFGCGERPTTRAPPRRRAAPG